MDTIKITPIGKIFSPYKEAKMIPIQGRFKDDVVAYAELFDKYVPGLKDLADFSHAILIFHFHKSDKENILGQPYLEENKHGIFSVRSPHRPNHIGMSVVKIKEIVENKLFFTQVDIFDQTPLLDIKPYVEYFDNRKNVKSGWLDKHFKDGIPDGTIL